MKTKTLYRPVGEKELILIAECGFKKFPPRLESQPIFYPVLNAQYAVDIALKCNTNDSFGNYLGFVTSFEIAEEEFNKYKVQNVGEIHHNELWVPAEDLEGFNAAILHRIKVIRVFAGKQFKNFTSESLIDSIEFQNIIYKSRIEIYLGSKSREIIPFSAFEIEEETIENQKEIDFEALQKQARLINSIDHAVDFLIEKVLSQKEISTIKNETPYKPIRRSIDNHFGINLFLRNLFSRMENKKLQKSIGEYETSCHDYGEHGEGILADALWKRLHHCELSKSPNRDKIKKIEKQIDQLYENFYEKKGLNWSKRTGEEYNKISSDLDAFYKRANIHKLNRWIELLSYNFEEKDIDEYLSIDDNSEDFYWENEFRKDAILAKIKDSEKENYIKLRDDYIETVKVVDQLIDLINEN